MGETSQAIYFIYTLYVTIALTHWSKVIWFHADWLHSEIVKHSTSDRNAAGALVVNSMTSNGGMESRVLAITLSASK